MKNKNTYKNVIITSIITAILITSGIGIAYAADNEFSGTSEFGDISTNVANGTNSAAFGIETIASGHGSTAFGLRTTANNHYSTAFGVRTTASGGQSTAFGYDTIASGNQSASFGVATTATAYASTAFGQYTAAQPYISFVIGRYNEISGNADSWISTDPLFVIGNGSDSINPNNAVTVLKNGNVGIGVSAPTEQLQIVGIIESISGGFKFPDGTTQTTASVDTQLDQAGIEAFGFVTGSHTVDTNLWTQSGNDLSYTTGNVGIGTTTPSNALDVM